MDVLPDSAAAAGGKSNKKARQRVAAAAAAAAAAAPSDAAAPCVPHDPVAEALNKQLLKVRGSRAQGTLCLDCTSFRDMALECAQAERLADHAGSVVAPAARAADCGMSGRFFVVSKWIGRGDDAKYFPVFGPLKHFFVHRLASLLAENGWRGRVRGSDVDAKLLAAAQADDDSAFHEERGLFQQPRHLECAVRALASGSLASASKSKRDAKNGPWKRIGPELFARAKDLAAEAPVDTAVFRAAGGTRADPSNPLRQIPHGKFVQSLGAVSSIWNKMAKSKKYRTPREIFFEYALRDNIIFARISDEAMDGADDPSAN